MDNNVTQSGKDIVDWIKNTEPQSGSYPDNTGYNVDVNITDKLVGEPKHVVWEGNDVYLR